MKKVYSYLSMITLLGLLSLQASGQSPQAAAQPGGERVVVQGTVIDGSDNTPMSGANVISPGEQRGVTTDRQGKFSIRIRPGSELKFSFVGYKDVTRKISGAVSDLKIVLDPDNQQIQEVLVMGPLTLAPTNVTSATTTVYTKDLPIAPFTNAMEALQGVVPGLNVQVTSGAPGSTGTYVIRGISDISTEGDYLVSSSPLIVVDGVPWEDTDDFDQMGLVSGSGVSPLTSIPLEDIDNFQVLKDAAAASLYGSKGAYGVIIINTKVGNSETPQVSYSFSSEVKIPPRLRDVIGGSAERRLRIEEIMAGDTTQMYPGFYLINSHPILADSLNPYWNNNTDWQDIYYNARFSQTHNLSVSGGRGMFRYKVNAHYKNDRGIIKNTGYNLYQVKPNIVFAPNDKFNIRVDLTASLSENTTGSGNLMEQAALGSTINNSSLMPPPTYYGSANDELAALNKEVSSIATLYSATVAAEYRPLPKVTVKGTFGYRYSNTEKDDFTPGKLNNNMTRQQDYGVTENYIYARGSLHYNTNISFIKLGVNTSVEIDKKTRNTYDLNLSGFPNDYIGGPVGYSPKNSAGWASLSDEAASVAFTIAPTFGIGSLAKGVGKSDMGMDKYVFIPLIRPELNAAYGSRKKWEINPGLSFRWNIIAEPFMRRLDFISNAAIRTSWGRTTKYKASLYDIWGSYLLDHGTYNGSPVIPIDYNASLPNPELKPITNTMWDIGIELGLWGNRLMLTSDVYYKQVDNQLSELALANHNGFSNQKSTETSLVNYGLEFSLTGRPLRPGSDVMLTAQLNFALNRDVITKLPGDVRQIVSSNSRVVSKVGTNALSHYLYVNKGVYAKDADVPVDPVTGRRLRALWNTSHSNNDAAHFRAGDPIWVDVNGDYIIDEKDRVIVGNSQPRITGGFNFNIRYRSWSLSANSSFTLRRDIINAALAQRFQTYSDPKNPTVMLPISRYNFWRPDNTNAQYPNPYDFTRTSLIRPFREDQSLYMEDGSYFKINTVSLTYQMDRRAAAFLGLSNLNITASINNLYTFTNYSGINPENVTSLGYDNSSGYPSARTAALRIQINF